MLNLQARDFAILLPWSAHRWAAAAAATEVSLFIFPLFLLKLWVFFSYPNQKRRRDESAVFCIHTMKGSDAQLNNQQCVCSPPRQALTHVSGFIDHNIMYIKLPRGDSGILHDR